MPTSRIRRVRHPYDDEVTSDRPRVLVADDEESMRELIVVTLDLHGFDVVGAVGDGDEAVAAFEALDPAPAAVVLDQRMPGPTGVETARRILKVAPNQVIVLFSAGLNLDVVSEALNTGILQCIDKLEVKRLPQVLRVLLGL